MKAANITYMDIAYEFLNKTYNIKRYSSINLETIHLYLDSIDRSWFEYIKLNVDQTLESALYAYYHSEDYYDLILLINYREMLSDMPYSNDKIINDINSDLEEYAIKLYNQGVSFNTNYIKPETCAQKRIDNPEELIKNRRYGPYQRLSAFLQYKYNKLNSLRIFLKVPKLQYIHKIISGVRDIITTEQEVLELQDLQNS